MEGSSTTTGAVQGRSEEDGRGGSGYHMMAPAAAAAAAAAADAADSVEEDGTGCWPRSTGSVRRGEG